MRTGLFVVYALLIVLLSCKNGNRLLETSYRNNKITKAKYTEILIHIDSLTYSFEYYMAFDYFEKNGEVLFWGFNNKTHSFDIINLTRRRVVGHLKLDNQGPNGIGIEIHGINIISEDSILIADETKFSIINKDGRILWELMKNDPLIFKDIPNGYLLTRNEAFKPGFNKTTNSLIVYYLPIENKYVFKMPIIMSIEINSRKTSFLPFYYPEFATLNGDSYFPLYGGPQSCYTSDKLIVTFTFESNIYVYDYKKKSVVTFGGKSKYTSNQSPKYDSRQNPEDFRLTTINFFQMVYDTHRRLYYRTHWGEMNLKKSEFVFNTWPEKPIFLMVFDENFNCLFETQLDIENGIVPAHVFPSPEGIYVFPWKQDVENLKNNTVKGIVIDLK